MGVLSGRAPRTLAPRGVDATRAERIRRIWRPAPQPATAAALDPARAAGIAACDRTRTVVLGLALDHCLERGGDHLAPRHCRLMTDCAAICATTADFLLRRSAFAAASCALCAEICTTCADSCAGLDGMADCVAACRECALRCRSLAA